MKKKGILYAVGVAFFVVGWILCMLDLFLCDRNIDAFRRSDTPINTVERISDAAYCEATGYVYVFYQMGCYVNVYDTSGKFRWAAQIPAKQNGTPHAVFHEDKLLYSFGDTYVLDAASGELTEIKSGLEAYEIYDVTNSKPVVHSATEVEYSENGETTTIVKKSFFILLLQPFGGMIAFSGGAILILNGIIQSFKERKSRNKTRNKKI